MLARNKGIVKDKQPAKCQHNIMMERITSSYFHHSSATTIMPYNRYVVFKLLNFFVDYSLSHVKRLAIKW